MEGGRQAVRDVFVSSCFVHFESFYITAVPSVDTQVCHVIV